MSRSPSRLLQELRAQHQAFDLVGAAFDFVRIVREVDVFDHGAALGHGGRALQLQVLDQRDGVAFGELCAVGVPDLDVDVMLLLGLVAKRSSSFSPCGRRCLAEGKADEGFSPRILMQEIRSWREPLTRLE